MKKKLLTLCLVATLLVASVTGATLAYFTDTDDATNTFTAGNIKIDLTEAEVKLDASGNYVADGAGTRRDVLDNEADKYDFGKIYPAQEICKDPTIEILDGSEEAYIAAKIIITDGVGDLHTYQKTQADGSKVDTLLLGIDGTDYIDISKVVTGGLMNEPVTQVSEFGDLKGVIWDTTTSAIYQEANRTAGEYTIYCFIKNPMNAKDKVCLFEKITVPATWDNE